MKNIILLIFLFSSLSYTFAQEKKDSKVDPKSTLEKTNSPQAEEGDIVFTDGTNQLLKITDEGTSGAIYFLDGVPSNTANKLYSNGSTLYFNGYSLGSGGASDINGLSDAKTDVGSLFLGAGSGNNDDGINYNTGVGYQSLKSNTTGYNNTATGSSSLYNNTTGSANTATGYGSLGFNTTGYNNTATGFQALYSNTTGYQNTVTGTESLFLNTTGDDNVSIGFHALHYNNGNKNVAIGSGALGQLVSPTTFNGNIAIGYNAGFNETGSNKLYIENSDSPDPLIYGEFTDGSELVKINGDLYSAGRTYGANFTAGNLGGYGIKAVATDLSTGLYQGNIGGSFEAKAGEGIGVKGLASNSSALTNYGGFFYANGESGVGVYGYAGTTTGTNYGGSFEAKGTTGYGVWAKAPATGWAGYFDGHASISNKVFIGTIPQSPQSSLHIKQQSGIKAIRMEYDSDTDYWDTYIDEANDYNFDFNGVLRAYIQDGSGSFIISSDERLKNNINKIDNVLQTVIKLEPKRYVYNNDETRKEQIGLIAQDVEKLFPEAVSEKDGYKGINYGVFGVLAIEAIKEQQILIENLTKRIEQLESRK